MSKIERSREEVLLSFLDVCERENDEKIRNYILRYHEIDRGFSLAMMCARFECRAIKSYALDDDLNFAKQNFYMHSLLREAANAAGFNSDFREVALPSDDFAYALLSDSPDRIKAIANAGLWHKDDPKTYHFYAAIFQGLLKDEYQQVKENVHLGAEKAGKRLRNELAAGNDFFSLFLDKDIAGLEAHILKLAKRKPDIQLSSSFINHWAAMCAKLCWIKGLEVQIDHPLVPMALMPVKPLEHYEIEYDFLLPDWQPPRQTWFDKVTRLLK